MLVMSFIGSDGWYCFCCVAWDSLLARPAPKLKDAKIAEAEACELYVECAHMVRRLYQDCHLVHGDLSEYNMLFVS